MAAITEVNASNFDSLLQEQLPVLIDFWAPWCGPCRMVSPIVDQIADELAGRLVVAKCNVDENQDIAMRYGVMSIPTLVILKGGAEANRIVGAMPKPKLLEEIEKAL
ncbi:thioredoxin [Enorma sp.]|uniref:thioredoxin n=1 Tax=Enorma sp. TaxID=1920692 RepID=UPI0025BC715E|nr:thioredoxin [Enorma sp.]